MKNLIKTKQPIHINNAIGGFSYTLNPDSYGFKYLGHVKGNMGSQNFFDKVEAYHRVGEAIGMTEGELHMFLMKDFAKNQYKIVQNPKTKKWNMKGTKEAFTHHKKMFNKLGWSVISTINFIQGKNKPKMSN